MTDCDKIPTLQDIEDSKLAMDDIGSFTYDDTGDFVDAKGVSRKTISGLVEVIDAAATQGLDDIAADVAAVDTAADEFDAVAIDRLNDLDAAYAFTAINGGVWANGEIFTAFNQWMNFDGVIYSPLPGTSLPHVVGATPNLGFVEVNANLSQAQGDQRYDKSATLANAIAATDVELGQVFRIEDKNDELFDVLLTSSVTVNGFNIIQFTDPSKVQFSLKEREAYRVNNKYKEGFKNLKILAHRGAFIGYPENTLLTTVASPGGADAVEFDVLLTSDKKWICMHDLTVDRTTDGTGAVSTFTLAAIQALDAGSWFDPIYAGTKVPLATKMVEAIKVAQKIPIIEVKEVAPSNAELKDLIDQSRLSTGGDNFIIACSDVDILNQCRTEDKDVKLMHFISTLIGPEIAQTQALQPCVAGIQGSLLNVGLRSTLNNSGLYVTSQTSTGQSITKVMLTLGASGVLTDSFVGVRQ